MVTKYTFPAFLIFVLAFFGGTLSYAQHKCATPELTDSAITIRELTRPPAARFGSARRAANVQYIPIQFHVLRKSNGAEGPSVSTLNQAVALLNQLYQPVGISFYQCGTQPHYIDNTSLYDYDTSEESLLTGANDVSNAINIYIPNSILYGGSPATGYSYYPSTLAITNRIFVISSELTGTSLAHEMGHYFNLYHTFQSNRSSLLANRELVIRPGSPQGMRPYAANCATAGDFVCDTPADPYGVSGATTSGCAYTGYAIDANGDVFVPQTTNIMSYYACSNQFTPGQYARIATGLSMRLDPANAYKLDCIAPSLAAPTNLSLQIHPAGVLVQFSYPNASAAGFLIERAVAGTNSFTTVGGLPPTSFSFVDGSILPNTAYTYRVKATNATNQYSPEQSITVGLFYCRPAYVWTTGSIIGKIENFSLQGSQTTLRSLATGMGSDGYSNFTATPHAVLVGQPYAFTASAMSSSSGGYMYQHLTIWLDSNQDGLFTDSEVLFKSSGGQLLSPSLTGTLRIPATALPGQTRLRLRSQYVGDGPADNPCATYDYGEAEDYTLALTAPVPITCFSLSATAKPTSCATSNDGQVALTATNGSGPYSYSLAARTSSTGSFTGLPSGTYTARVADLTTGCSSSLAVSVNQPLAESAVLGGSTAVCGSQSVALTVAITGSKSPYLLVLNDGQTDRNVAGYVSGTPILTTPLTTTTFQLKSVTDSRNCPVLLNPGSATATVVVNQASPLTISPGSASLCTGESITLQGNGEGSFRWNTGQVGTSLLVSSTGAYSVTLTNATGCTSVAVASVQVRNCPQPVRFSAKVLLEGYTDPTTGLMSKASSLSWFPKQQPYNASPWLYTGTESVSVLPNNTTDWVLIVARNASGVVLSRQAAFVRNDGLLLDIDGSEGVLLPPVSEPIYVAVSHRNHLSIITNDPVVSGRLVDFTSDASLAKGSAQLKPIGTKFALFAGDFNSDNVVNNKDFNLWRATPAAVGKYLAVDSDGNGIINNKDYNRWAGNRSKIGTPGL
ncbi:GEVED domain-containing protein [Fibrella sp. ES10-3-2-2]|nr:hypothetical protein A6C57_16035 [Fibrella sp. ES10-3-2-2]